MAVSNLIQPVFKVGRKVYIDDSIEILLKKIRYLETDFRWNKLLSFLGHVAAFLYGIKNRSVCGRAADSLFFEYFDQACFCISGGRRSKVLIPVCLDIEDRITLLERRDNRCFFFILLLILGWLHDCKTIKENVKSACL